MGPGKTPGRFGRAMRDFFIRRFFAKPPRNPAAQDWTYEYPIDWDAGVTTAKS